MKPKHWTLAAAIAFASCAIIAMAQQPQTSRAARETQTPSQKMAAERGEMNLIGVQRGANQIMGMNVRNTSGETLGKVEDIVLENQHGQIAYAILASGGVFGIGQKHYAVPWQAFSNNDDQLALNVSKDRMKFAPTIPKGQLPGRSDAKFYQHLREFYHTPTYAMTAEQPIDEPATTKTVERETVVENTGNMHRPAWKFWAEPNGKSDWSRRVSDLIGTKVVNARNEDLGDIDDLVIDMAEGRLSYALIRYGGLQMQTAAVPWNALILNRLQDVYALDATIDQLDLALLSDQEVAKLQDEQFGRTIHDAFGVEPYWAAYETSPQRKVARTPTATDKSHRVPSGHNPR